MRSLILIAFLLSSPAFAQDTSRPVTSQGSWLVGGTAAISHHSDEVGESNTNYGLFPNLMYFVSPGLAMGGILGFSRVDADNSRGTSTTIGPALRYYFSSASTRTLPYVGATVQLANSRFSSTNPSGEFTVRFSSTMLEGFAGVTVMVSRQVGFYGEAFYNKRTGDVRSDTPVSPGDIEETNLGIRFGLAAFIVKGSGN